MRKAIIFQETYALCYCYFLCVCFMLMLFSLHFSSVFLATYELCFAQRV